MTLPVNVERRRTISGTAGVPPAVGSAHYASIAQDTVPDVRRWCTIQRSLRRCCSRPVEAGETPAVPESIARRPGRSGVAKKPPLYQDYTVIS